MLRSVLIQSTYTLDPCLMVAQLSSPCSKWQESGLAAACQSNPWRVTLGIKVCLIIPKHAQTEVAKGRYPCAIKSRHNSERFRASPAWSVPEKEPPWPATSDLGPRTNLCMCESVCVRARGRVRGCVGAWMRGCVGVCACMRVRVHIYTGRFLR